MGDIKFTLQIQVECGAECPSLTLRETLGCPDCPRQRDLVQDALGAGIIRLVNCLQEHGYKISLGESPESFYRQWTCYRVKFLISEGS